MGKNETEEVFDISNYILEDGMYWSAFEVGGQYTDFWTGTAGLCIAISMLETGCIRVMLETEDNSQLTGKNVVQWYDPERLIGDDEELVELFGYPSGIILGDEYEHAKFKIKGFATELHIYGAGKENMVSLKRLRKGEIKSFYADEGELIHVESKAVLNPTGTGAPVAAMYL